MTPAEAKHHDPEVAALTRVRSLVVQHVGQEVPDRIATSTIDQELRRELAEPSGTPEFRAWVEAAAKRRGLL